MLRACNTHDFGPAIVFILIIVSDWIHAWISALARVARKEGLQLQLRGATASVFLKILESNQRIASKIDNA